MLQVVGSGRAAHVAIQLRVRLVEVVQGGREDTHRGEHVLQGRADRALAASGSALYGCDPPRPDELCDERFTKIKLHSVMDVPGVSLARRAASFAVADDRCHFALT